ncbi:hypothetical protein CLV42_103529 [Chitinophaga ginsengisoli]|uniref:Uncharacterized protein n=1 Tax=Chitinophaga ginsengisoli TaxID=363837 RepID=A0A2P8GHU2_9BACT|nr:hypothetical protein CLV42_103529 [Chitinophaga ginsengisoli]
MSYEYDQVLFKIQIAKALFFSPKSWDKLSTHITDGKLHINNDAI